MSFDAEKFDADNRARLSEIGGIASVDSADSVEDALMKQRALPMLCTLYDGSRSDGRVVPSNKGQRLAVRLTVIVVAESWLSKADGKRGALPLIKAVKNTIVTSYHPQLHPDEWKNPQADGPFVYVEDAFMQREKQRVAYQIDFRTNVYDDFN